MTNTIAGLHTVSVTAHLNPLTQEVVHSIGGARLPVHPRDDNVSSVHESEIITATDAKAYVLIDAVSARRNGASDRLNAWVS